MNEFHITDHETIKINILPKKTYTPQKNKCISWKNYNKDALMHKLRRTNWNYFDKMTIEQKSSCIRENLINSVKEITTTIELRNRIKKCKWFDNEAKDLKIQKYEKYKKWANDRKNENAHEEYKAIRNECSKMNKQKKCAYNRNQIIAAANDQKKMWNCLRNLVTKKTKIK